IKLGQGVTESKPSRIKDPDGNELDVDELGGLHIVGSERHEARRIDRQLRGRAGRQGDPGASQFFLSLEDDLMRMFGSERIGKLMDRMGAQEGEVLTHPLITRSIEQAQKRVELQNFQSRKRLLEYDDVMNQQREVIYSLRAFALEGGEELKGEAEKMVERAVARRVENIVATFDAEDEWDLELVKQDLLMHFVLPVPEYEIEGQLPTKLEGARDTAVAAGRKAFSQKLAGLTDFSEQLLALVMLSVIDEKWKDHLYDLDQLRNAIHYRSWGQKDPLVEYKHEAYTMFVDLMQDIYNSFTERFFRAQIVFEEPPGRGEPPGGRPRAPAPKPVPSKPVYNALGALEAGPGEGGAQTDVMDIGPGEPPNAVATARPDPKVVGVGRVRSLAQGAAHTPADWGNVGRNDRCPCGSGKKFKKCHGAVL
ncbi:MAG: SEC-C metal-binding domain-containing protein, partial [Gemmatimonadaceae bacterium]|nr:SEC-C metal-binding domain-containing protein [Gemmatimonadaceae bacterium]